MSYQHFLNEQKSDYVSIWQVGGQKMVNLVVMDEWKEIVDMQAG